MIAKKVLTLLTFTACLVGLAARGSQNHPVPRPNKGHGYDTVVVSLVDGSFVASEHGQATHTGQYVTHFVGQMDLTTFQVIWGEGCLTAANGDQLLMEMTPGGPHSFVITGGTGRFEGATGSGTMVNSGFVITVDPAAGTMTITNQATMEGTITY